MFVVAGRKHGGTEDQVAEVVERGQNLLGESLLIAAFGQPTAFDAIGAGIRLIHRGGATGNDALAEIDADDMAILPHRAGVVGAVAAAVLPGHGPPPEAGETRGRTQRLIDAFSRRRTPDSV